MCVTCQYKVEVYDGKLYVGEDNGIKVRDLETLSVLTSVSSGSVLDFAIENGEIGLYKNALFSPVEIRDAETLTLKADEFFGCFEIEVGSSFDRFYLSCDDETYRFEDDGDEVCDGTPINCEDLDSNYVSGIATCNATCDGYNTNNCSDDGW